MMNIRGIFESMDLGNPLSNKEIDYAVSCLTSILGVLDLGYKPYNLMTSDMHWKLIKLKQWQEARKQR